MYLLSNMAILGIHVSFGGCVFEKESREFFILLCILQVIPRAKLAKKKYCVPSWWTFAPNMLEYRSVYSMEKSNFDGFSEYFHSSTG